MKRPCLVCGIPTEGSRCLEHQRSFERVRGAARQREHRFKYGGDYRGRAAAVRATATRCHICGDGYRAWDPWQADHLIQGTRAEGGGADGPLAPAHRSCNIRRSNQARKGRKQP